MKMDQKIEIIIIKELHEQNERLKIDSAWVYAELLAFRQENEGLRAKLDQANRDVEGLKAVIQTNRRLLFGLYTTDESIEVRESEEEFKRQFPHIWESVFEPIDRVISSPQANGITTMRSSPD